MNAEELKQIVKEKYGEIAKGSEKQDKASRFQVINNKIPQ